VLLPKHYAEEGRVSLYKGYSYFTGFVGNSQRVEAGNGAEEEEANCACWETQHHTWKWDQSFPATRGQENSQRASMLGRSDGDRQQVPSPWHWVRPLPAT